MPTKLDERKSLLIAAQHLIGQLPAKLLAGTHNVSLQTAYTAINQWVPRQAEIVRYYYTHGESYDGVVAQFAGPSAPAPKEAKSQPKAEIADDDIALILDWLGKIDERLTALEHATAAPAEQHTNGQTVAIAKPEKQAAKRHDPFRAALHMDIATERALQQR